ncbi:MAG: SRPBCC family protein [Bacteroidetes bacterium]|nr:SRPBCC family protein [Bacteroidota bacterium]
MGIILIIVYVIAGIIALFLLTALLTKKEFRLQKQVTINKPLPEVFQFVKLIRNQEKYSVWVMKDPNIQITYTGTDGTVGFTSAWVSNDKNVGIGEQEIMSVKENESMQVVIRFKKPFEGTNYALTTFTAHTPSQTIITQTFSGKQKFPMNVMNLFMDKLVGGDMQKNLNNLKALLE